MNNQFVELLFKRAQRSKEESDSDYFFSLLYTGEALAKLMVLGILATIIDDREKNRAVQASLGHTQPTMTQRYAKTIALLSSETGEKTSSAIFRDSPF